MNYILKYTVQLLNICGVFVFFVCKKHLTMLNDTEIYLHSILMSDQPTTINKHIYLEHMCLPYEMFELNSCILLPKLKRTKNLTGFNKLFYLM